PFRRGRTPKMGQDRPFRPAQPAVRAPPATRAAALTSHSRRSIRQTVRTPDAPERGANVQQMSIHGSATAAARLRGALQGRVIEPDDPAYDAARAVYFTGIDRRPAAVVRAA